MKPNSGWESAIPNSKGLKDAIRILNELLPTFLSPARMVQVFTLLGDNYLELKDRLTALHWYGKGLLIPGQPNEELKKKVKSIIDAPETEEELNPLNPSTEGPMQEAMQN